MKTSKIVLLIVGSLLGLIALGLVAGGAALLVGDAVVDQDADGFYTTDTYRLATDTRALTFEELDLGDEPGTQAWVPRIDDFVTFRLNLSADQELFVGVARPADVAEYLDGVAHAEVLDTSRAPDGVDYATTAGDREPAPPGEQTIWDASTTGTGDFSLTWEPSAGDWAVVVMQPDAGPGLALQASAGAEVSWLVPLAAGLLAVGLLLGAGAVAMLVLATRKADLGVAADRAPGTAAIPGPYPMRLEGHLDPELSRWRWLVKWFLAIPHFVVLALLWPAFVLLTIAAGFAILFTGRYPSSIFAVNVGILRWTWRVAFYATSALGTDRYPPFTLAHVEDYPAKLDVVEPGELSRGLVLVKWWLLAIPHYLIVGLLTSGLFAWTWSDSDWSAGSGLISILVFVAAVILLVTARYPKPMFDLVVGLNRWVYRVAAYAALMTDEYPPFRLDQGGSEPPTPGGPASPEPSSPEARELTPA